MSSNAFLDALVVGAPPFLGLRVRLQRGALDRALADGARPYDSPALSLRARQLATRPEADRVANRLQAILDELDRPPERVLSARVPLRRAQIADARPFVANLIECLRDVEHPRAVGVACARQLVVDGTSPVYSPAQPGALASLAWRAAHAL
jgi:hypothetical protein